MRPHGCVECQHWDKFVTPYRDACIHSITNIYSNASIFCSEFEFALNLDIILDSTAHAMYIDKYKLTRLSLIYCRVYSED